jgi:ribosome recycling factor
MSNEIEDVDLDDLEKRMAGALNSLKHDFNSLRTGRASASMLDAVLVDAYGTATPINQVATINVPEPRMVSVNVWDKTMVAAVDKAIRQSGLGLNPVMDGTTLRLPIPELNEERRRELSKLAGQYGEKARIGMDHLKKLKESMGEDDQKLWHDEIQELTDKAITNIDKTLETKQEEIMQV